MQQKFQQSKNGRYNELSPEQDGRTPLQDADGADSENLPDDDVDDFDDWELLSHRHQIGAPQITEDFASAEKDKVTSKPINRPSYFDKAKKNFPNSLTGQMMGRRSMPNADFVHRTTSIKVNYPADRPR